MAARTERRLAGGFFASTRTAEPRVARVQSVESSTTDHADHGWVLVAEEHAVLGQQFVVGGALEEGVGLDLVDRRGDLVVQDQVDETVREEVRHADGAYRALL